MKQLLLAIALWALSSIAAFAQGPTQCIVPANAAATPVISASAEGSHILKTTPGCLLGVYVVGGSSAGFILIFNSATVPSDGAVTPQDCVPIAANSYQYINFAPLPPEWFSSGIVAVYSTTGCFTKTISSGAFFHALVQ